MGIRNERNAGRKPSISEDVLAEIKVRHEQGETVTALAKEYQVSRQTLSGYLNRKDGELELIYDTYCKWAKLNREFRNVNLEEYSMRMEYMCEEECCTVILVNFKEKKIMVQNETDEIIHRAFGVKVKPTWEDFEHFLEERCFPRTRAHLKSVLKDIGVDSYDPLAIIEKTKGRMAEDKQWIRITYFRA